MAPILEPEPQPRLCFDSFQSFCTSSTTDRVPSLGGRLYFGRLCTTTSCAVKVSWSTIWHFVPIRSQGVERKPCKNSNTPSIKGDCCDRWSPKIPGQICRLFRSGGFLLDSLKGNNLLCLFWWEFLFFLDLNLAVPVLAWVSVPIFHYHQQQRRHVL